MSESAASKQERQDTLKTLLREEELYAQSDIVGLMSQKGYPVTQPSISRDLREIGAIKVSGRYLATSDLPSADRFRTRDIQPAGPHLIVIRTTSGAAPAVAAQIDDLSLSGVAGSVAGDDTIFLALSDPECQDSLINSLRHSL